MSGSERRAAWRRCSPSSIVWTQAPPTAPRRTAGQSDAPIVAEQLGLGGADALLDLPNHAAWTRLLVDGVPTSSLRLDLLDGQRPRRQTARRLMRTSRNRFGRPRRDVEDRIGEFLAT